MKKILAIAPYPYLPFFSGGQKYIAYFFEYLGKETDLTIITVKGNNNAAAKNYKPVSLLKPKSFSRYTDFSLISKITSIVKKEGFDTIIWEHPYFAWLAFRVKKRTGVKTIIHTHNIEHQRFRSTGRWWWPILKKYEQWCFKKADAIFFITPEDKSFAINNWKIAKEKCIDLPFGVEINKFPDDRESCRASIAARHSIPDNEKILFFNGLLDYKPNLDALKVILDEINPLLLAQPSFHYKIIICGKRLPAELNSLAAYANKNIIYAGYADDITAYYKAADLFLNPVQSGGGIKTKMVEAIAYGATVIATGTGAAGIIKNVCGDKLVTAADNDWNEFSKAILDNINNSSATPQQYYGQYYWGNIVKNVVNDLADQAAGKTVGN
jgi:glycosyltransferase involved in cell wall biosynthesis